MLLPLEIAENLQRTWLGLERDAVTLGAARNFRLRFRLGPSKYIYPGFYPPPKKIGKATKYKFVGHIFLTRKVENYLSTIILQKHPQNWCRKNDRIKLLSLFENQEVERTFLSVVSFRNAKEDNVIFV